MTKSENETFERVYDFACRDIFEVSSHDMIAMLKMIERLKKYETSERMPLNNREKIEEGDEWKMQKEKRIVTLPLDLEGVCKVFNN